MVTTAGKVAAVSSSPSIARAMASLFPWGYFSLTPQAATTTCLAAVMTVRLSVMLGKVAFWTGNTQRPDASSTSSRPGYKEPTCPSSPTPISMRSNCGTPSAFRGSFSADSPRNKSS